MSSGGIGSPVRMSRFDWRANLVPAAGLALPVVSSGPKFSLNWICFSSSIGWSRKRSTECSSNAARIGPNSRGLSGRVMSMPEISAPKSGCSFLTVMGPVLRIGVAPCRLVHDRLISEDAKLAADRIGRGRHELGQQHHRHVLGWIAPEGGRGGAAPGVFAWRADDMRLGRIDHDREAEPEADTVVGRFGEARRAHVGHVAVEMVHGH